MTGQCWVRIILGLGFMMFWTGIPGPELIFAAQEPAPPAQAPAEIRLTDGVTAVADKVGKAVVSVSTEHTVTPAETRRGSPPGNGPQSPGEDPFEQFFKGFPWGDQPGRGYRQIGLGSGVIIDQDGYILTNEHVIGEADKITVTLSDGRKFKGEVKGKDARSDLAVIKIEADNLPVATLGDSDNLKIGQWVVAIGNPFGFAVGGTEPTVTAGVVSALHRSLLGVISEDRDYNDLIQTDAAINPGNSGGPLVNLDGEVIALNSTIFSTSGGYEGIGFAIPINKAKRIMASLVQGKPVQYGWLGIAVQDVTPELAQYFGLKDTKGALAADIVAGSPADKAGIKSGDLITAVAGTPVANARELITQVNKLNVGQKVPVKLIRDRKETTVQVTIGERPAQGESAQPKPAQPKPEPLAAWRGLNVAEITPEIAQQLHIKPGRGVVVVAVEAGTPAADAGLRPGDVILEINRRPVNNLSDYEQAINQTKGQVLIKTARGFIVINPSES